MIELKTLPDFPTDLYEKHDFHPVMLPPVPLRHVSLNESVYPHAVIETDWKVGGYLENRKGMYSSPIYNAQRFIHLGIDIWAPEGEPVFAIADGEVLGAVDNNNPLDYGPTVVIEHEVDGFKFFALYGHLDRASLSILKNGTLVQKGDAVASIGSMGENGGWIPHLHFMLGISKPNGIDMPGVCAPEEVDIYRRLHPDPRYVLGPLY